MAALSRYGTAAPATRVGSRSWARACGEFAVSAATLRLRWRCKLCRAGGGGTVTTVSAAPLVQLLYVVVCTVLWPIPAEGMSAPAWMGEMLAELDRETVSGAGACCIAAPS